PGRPSGNHLARTGRRGGCDRRLSCSLLGVRRHVKDSGANQSCDTSRSQPASESGGECCAQELRGRRWPISTTDTARPAFLQAFARTAALGALAKDFRADAHVRGAKVNGRLEVGAHAHAELSEVEFGSELGKKGKMNARRLVGRRNAHEAGDGELELFAAKAQQARGLTRQHARLLTFLAGIDLDEKLKFAALFERGLGDSLGDLGAVDAMDGVEQEHRLLGLVGLQGTDEMQRGAGVVLPQLGPFGLGFLHPVFAKDAVASLEHGPDMLWAKSLANGDEGHRLGRTLVGHGRGRNAGADGGEAGGGARLAHAACACARGREATCARSRGSGPAAGSSLASRSRYLRLTKTLSRQHRSSCKMPSRTSSLRTQEARCRSPRPRATRSPMRQ